MLVVTIVLKKNFTGKPQYLKSVKSIFYGFRSLKITLSARNESFLFVSYIFRYNTTKNKILRSLEYSDLILRLRKKPRYKFCAVHEEVKSKYNKAKDFYSIKSRLAVKSTCVSNKNFDLLLRFLFLSNKSRISHKRLIFIFQF